MKIISDENKIVLIKRLKSLAWRVSGMGLISLVNFAGSSIELFDLPQLAVVIIGLVIGEITKALNNSVQK